MCQACQKNQNQQRKEPLEPHDIPPTPWTKLAADLFYLDGIDYLLITDYHSKFPVIRRMHNTSSASVATVMRETFSMLGVPAELISDNGPQFTGKPFKDMCEKWNIKHTTSSPRYPRSNGLAERMVSTVKSLIKKCRQTGQDVQEALLHLRATPQADLPSPAEMMFGRRIKTTLPGPHLIQNGPNMSDVHEKLLQRREDMKRCHDKHAGKELPELSTGQRVRVRDLDGTWFPAEVSRMSREPRSYEVTTPNGRVLRRNRSQLREMSYEDCHDTQTTKPKVTFAIGDEATTTADVKRHSTSSKGNGYQHKPYTTRYGREIHQPARYT